MSRMRTRTSGSSSPAREGFVMPGTVSSFLRWTMVASLWCGLGFVPAASGQQRHDPSVRYPGGEKEGERDATKTLVGQVVDQEGGGLAQAVVHLKNKKTLAVKTSIADDGGKFRIVGLDRDTDYAVHAEYRGNSSSDRTVSSFDDRSEIRLVLEIDASKQ